jgi:ElaB/YqjD/DUF883 family membrane-anchored ribosome-binding protein
VEEPVDNPSLVVETLARHEERIKSLEQWKDTLNADIRDLRLLIERSNENTSNKLDEVKDAVNEKVSKALSVAERQVPTWANWALYVFSVIVGLLGGLLLSHH